MTEQETCAVHRNSAEHMTHHTKFTGDKHQMFYYCSISCIATLMVAPLYNQAVLYTVGSSCFWQRIIPTVFEVLGRLCGCWQYNNVHLCCSVMGQLTEDNNIYCKTKVILTKQFTCSCWWWPSLAKTRRMNVKLIWTSSPHSANQSTVTCMHSHITVAFACPDLFLPAACVGHSVWSSGRDDLHRSVLKRTHTYTHTHISLIQHLSIVGWMWTMSGTIGCSMQLGQTF